MNKKLKDMLSWIYMIFVMIPLFLLVFVAVILWRKFLTLFGKEYVAPLEGIE